MVLGPCYKPDAKIFLILRKIFHHPAPFGSAISRLHPVAEIEPEAALRPGNQVRTVAGCFQLGDSKVGQLHKFLGVISDFMFSWVSILLEQNYRCVFLSTVEPLPDTAQDNRSGHYGHQKNSGGECSRKCERKQSPD